MRSDHPGTSDRGLLAVSCLASLLLGVIAGYIMGNRGATVPAPAATQHQVAAQSPQPVANEAELQTLRSMLARDPQNLHAATTLGNILYDAGRFAEAVPYYQQAFALDSKNANLSTDLGTSLWYAGRADDALTQYRKSLAADPTHAQTFFNIGIVRAEGKQDFLGAIEAWSDLLAAHPNYPEADKVKRLIAQTQQKVVSPMASRQ